MAKFFGIILAAGVAGTSLAMLVMKGKWQAVEAAGYSGEKRPWWFYLVSVLLIGFYGWVVVDFIDAPKNWANWVLVILIPLGWVIKGALLVFNPKGRQAISNISGDQSWVKIALARLPIAAVLGALAYFAL